MPTTPILAGDPAPWFSAPATTNPDFAFHSLAGRHVILTFTRRPESQGPAFTASVPELGLAPAEVVWFFVGSGSTAAAHLPVAPPSVQLFIDAEGMIGRLYGLAPDETGPISFVLSPRLQTIAVIDAPDPQIHAAAIREMRRRLVPLSRWRELSGPPPILIISDIFEPELCRRLIAGYESNGGTVSGFMREENGRTVARHDARHKVRRDWTIDEADLVKAIQQRFRRRVVPEIQKAYNFSVTRMERYIVACYDATEGGHFNAHRDNTTKGTAHRRFACSVNLNAEEFEGGDLRFPEFGHETFRPPTGGCVVFGCTLLHEATRVTRGRRYAFLPFLYDEAAARVRDANRQFIGTPAGPADPALASA